MSSSRAPEGSSSYDYTEGASAIDIQEALVDNAREMRRQDSTYGEDGEGALFDGPAHSVNPSSVSRMSIADHGRRNSGRWSRDEGRLSRSRRRSEVSSSGGRGEDSVVDYGSTSRERQADEDVEDSLEFSDEGEFHDMAVRRSRRKSPSPPPRSGVLGTLSQIFGTHTQVSESPSRSRRPSLSSRSSRTRLLRRQSSRRSDAGSDYAIESEADSDERWGYASSEEGDSEDESDEAHDTDAASMALSEAGYNSNPPTTGPSLPLMAGDPIFGAESRIEMGELEPLAPPPPGPPSRQTIYVADEDADVRMVGYEIVLWRKWLWRVCCVCTFGALALLGHWFPRLWLGWVTREKAFIHIRHGFIVVEVSLCESLFNIIV